MLGYLANPKLGAALYNLAHSETPVLLLAVSALHLHSTAALAVALIWLFHIGFDRALGYGLKFPTSFKDTHLQHVSEGNIS